PKRFKHPYAFDVPLRSWAELIVANAFYDRAGYVLLGDVYRHCSYGPWRRGLAKGDQGENFHLRPRENVRRRACAAYAARRPGGDRVDVSHDGGVVRVARLAEDSRQANRISPEGQHERSTAPGVAPHGGAALREPRVPGAGAP